MDGGGFQGVLFFKVEEALGELDLIHRAHSELIGTQYGTAYLETWDSLLQQQFPVVGKSGGYRPGQPLRAGDPGDTKRGPSPDGFHEKGIAQFRCCRFDFIHPRTSAEDYTLGHLHSG